MAITERSAQKLSDTDVLTTCVLDFPREQVFAAWVDPKLLTRWWGPRGFTSTFQEHDPRPGGAWRFVLHGPDGRDYKNHGVYGELIAPSRVVFEHQSGPAYSMKVELEALDGGRTRVVWFACFENPRFLAEHGELVLGANLENLERLDAVLAAP